MLMLLLHGRFFFFSQYETKCSNRNLGMTNFLGKYYKYNLCLVQYKVGILQPSTVHVSTSPLAVISKCISQKRILYSIFYLESTDELLQLGMFYTLGGIFDKQKCKDNWATTGPKYIFLNITSSIYIQILKVLLTSLLASNVMIPRFFISRQQISSNLKKEKKKP